MKSRLRLLRAERGWSQQQLADRLEVSRQSVNAIETGRYDPSLPLAFRIAELFGLTIDPLRLHQIRQQRRPDSRYAQLDTCKREVAAAEDLLRAQGIQWLSTTHASIEEIASRILESLGINREMF
jgi:regulator of PEP synthase PpsR (kinase-PPPase family)